MITDKISFTTPVFIYSKQIKDREVNKDSLRREIDKEKISNVIESLKNIGECKPFEYFELRDNYKEWVIEILNNDSKDKEVEYLLNDFTDSMFTRMREEDKYALAIVSRGFLLLCHSRMGEQTITPLWEVVDRMLDVDNLDRFVLFQKNYMMPVRATGIPDVNRGSFSYETT